MAWYINEKFNEIPSNINEKPQWEGLTYLMKYLLKAQSISYEKWNEIPWNINEKSQWEGLTFLMKYYWKCRALVMKSAMKYPEILMKNHNERA